MFILEKIELLAAIYELRTVTILATHCVNITQPHFGFNGDKRAQRMSTDACDLRQAPRPPCTTEGPAGEDAPPELVGQSRNGGV